MVMEAGSRDLTNTNQAHTDLTEPTQHFAVFASAGTGKTYQLVNRMLRLLLSGARADGILAITFTRKAAGEMQQRLIEQVRGWVFMEDPELNKALKAINLPATDEHRQQARSLYEALRQSTYGVRTLTFHSFCQELLKRFSLEANIPPGFKLEEKTLPLREQAWDALINEATRYPHGLVATHLEGFLKHSKSLSSTQDSLNSFLDNRSDWWSYTESQVDDRVAYALDQQRTQLNLPDAKNAPRTRLFSTASREPLKRFHDYLEAGTKKEKTLATELAPVLEKWFDNDESLATLKETFLTKKMQPLSRKASDAASKRCTSIGGSMEDFLELHAHFSLLLVDVVDVERAQAALEMNTHWMHLGNEYIQHYQRIKEQQRILDFADLEWHAYQLLNNSGMAAWVQYKLDSRIDHVLIDEFQDTNPTQWQLLLPLLEELAAGENDRQRSLFIVGDEKQSIYSFRRANPKLQHIASNWIEQSLNGKKEQLDKSWRSSPVIMDLVNTVFAQNELTQRINCPKHSTARTAYWGGVYCLPYAQKEPSEGAEQTAFRNPLLTPRPSGLRKAASFEAEHIANVILDLLGKRAVVNEDGEPHPCTPNDVFILLRNRTQAIHIEAALRKAGIPYQGTSRGALLERQEIRDLIALLNCLITPYDNLNLAQLLRSPIFNASNDDLASLAQGAGYWYENLLELTTPTETLKRAQHLLPQWQKLAAQVPLHDLLEHCFHHGEFISRFVAAARPERRIETHANLMRFLHLALENDGGRYPSVSRFMMQLEQIRAEPNDAPNEARPVYDGGRVQILTIHESKGLEAPIVFLADAAPEPKNNKAWKTLTYWPAENKQPAHFWLGLSQKKADSYTRKLIDQSNNIEHTEQAHLLYVAITRAKQYLYVSAQGTTAAKPDSWYALLRRSITILAQDPDNPTAEYCRGIPELTETMIERGRDESRTYHQPETSDQTDPQDIAPSQTVTTGGQVRNNNDDAKLRGKVIHRAIELFTTSKITDVEQNIFKEYRAEAPTIVLKTWAAEAQQLVNNPKLKKLFDANSYLQAWNEVSIYFERNNTTANGVIDRLIEFNDHLLVIDYKTQVISNTIDLEKLVNHYRPQLSWYRSGVELMRQDKPCKTALLFTHSGTLIST